MNSSIIFLVFVAIVEIIFYIQGEVRSMTTFAVVSILFALIFFLSIYRKNGKLWLTSVLDYWKPPHQRVKSITVGNSENTDDTVIRVENKVKEVSNTESGRDLNRNSNSSQTNTACVIPVAISNNRSD